MKYLVDPIRTTGTLLYVVYRTSGDSFPAQVDCGGYTLNKTGRRNTGQVQTVTCKSSGQKLKVQVWEGIEMI